MSLCLDHFIGGGQTTGKADGVVGNERYSQKLSSFICPFGRHLERWVGCGIKNFVVGS